MHAELWREGRLEGQEDWLLAETLYFRNEIQLFLANAGFAEVSVFTAYSGEEPTTNDTFLVFIAQQK
jgi:hypothetical protein